MTNILILPNHLIIPEEVIPAAVVLSAEAAGERPDSLVGLADVPLEAVELRERLPAGRPVLQHPQADLLLFGRNVFSFLFGDFDWRGFAAPVVLHAHRVGRVVADEDVGAPLHARRTSET